MNTPSATPVRVPVMSDRSRRRSRRGSSGPATRRRVAFGPRARRHQDREVQAYAAAARTRRQRAADAPNPASDQRLLAGELWQEHDLVFSSSVGTALDAANVRRAFKKITTAAGLGDNWKPLELRTSFVSLMSGSGVPVEEIARLAGQTSTRTTEVVYRRELRPVITTGAEVMDKIFSD
jgi:site-specific recombinase XerD